MRRWRATATGAVATATRTAATTTTTTTSARAAATGINAAGVGVAGSLLLAFLAAVSCLGMREPRMSQAQLDRLPPKIKLLIAAKNCIGKPDRTSNAFKTFVRMFEELDFMCIMPELTRQEQTLLVKISAQYFSKMCVSVTGLVMYHNTCVMVGVQLLPLMQSCHINAGVMKNREMLLLTRLMPNLESLKMSSSIARADFARFEKLKELHLQHSISQAQLCHISENCPQLIKLTLCNIKLGDNAQLDMSCLACCTQLSKLQLPLEHDTPPGLGKLLQLTELTLRREHLWPGACWVPGVQKLIDSKWELLQCIYLDGCWMPLAYDLTSLQLRYCTSLIEIHLSKMQLMAPPIERWAESPLPRKLQVLSFVSCTFMLTVALYRLLQGCPLLRYLDMESCILPPEQDIVRRILQIRRLQGADTQLQLRYNKTPVLANQYTQCDELERQQSLGVFVLQELDEPLARRANMLGAMTFKFNEPVIAPIWWRVPADELTELAVQQYEDQLEDNSLTDQSSSPSLNTSSSSSSSSSSP